MTIKKPTLPEGWQTMVCHRRKKKHGHRMKYVVYAGPVNQSGLLQPVKPYHYFARARQAKKFVARIADVPYWAIEFGENYPHTYLLELFDDERPSGIDGIDRSSLDWWTCKTTGQVAKTPEHLSNQMKSLHDLMIEVMANDK